MDRTGVAIIGTCIIILVGTIVGVVICLKDDDEGYGGDRPQGYDDELPLSPPKVAAVQKADNQETCVRNLFASTNSSQPQKFINGVIELALKEIGKAVKSSAFLEKISNDPKSAEAFNTCEKVLGDCRDDILRTSYELDSFSSIDRDKFIDDIKTWLTGALTYQQTCLDALENAQGEHVEKMKRLLNRASELTSNGLSLVNEISMTLSSLGSPIINRKLLSEPKGTKGRLFHTFPQNVKPDVTVATDGSGKYATIKEALQEVPLKSNETFVIYVKEGVYKECVTIEKYMWHVMLIGDGQAKTRITGNQSHEGILGTYLTATVVVEGDHFIARDICFENTAGPEMHQAMALRVTADESIFYNCHIDGYKNTMYAHNHRQFYRDCTISGTNDIIFGNARVILQKCNLIIKKPKENQKLCAITVQGRSKANQNSAVVLQNCGITLASEYLNLDKSYRAYLGRPWKKFSRTIVLDSELDGVINQDGSTKGNDTENLGSCWYAEFGNKETWQEMRKITEYEALEFTPGKYFLGDYWIKPTGIPYISGRMSRHNL